MVFFFEGTYFVGSFGPKSHLSILQVACKEEGLSVRNKVDDAMEKNTKQTQKEILLYNH